MEYVNFYERIHNIKDIKLLAKKICEYYDLGELFSQEHIKIGYEDFNMLINTSTGKYFVKILNKSRPKNEQIIVQRIFLKYLTTQSNNNINIERRADY